VDRRDIDNPSKAVQKTVPIEPRNSILVIAVNLPHETEARYPQAAHLTWPVTGKISWMKPLNPQKT
jgi:hypothetical protein